MSSKGHRAREKSRSRAEVVAPPIEQKSVENAVSKVQEDRKNRAWWAKDLLRLTASFITEAHLRREFEKSWKLRAFPTRGKVVLSTEKYARAAMYVGGHPKFRQYEGTFYEVYVNGTTDTMAMERMSEFEIALDAMLDRVPFYPERQEGKSNDVATDGLNGLVPMTTCARFLGIGRTTLFRWVNEGLIGELVPGIPSTKAVQKIGSQYFVNYLAALKWKEEHYRASKARNVEARNVA